MPTFTIPGRLPGLNEYTSACRTNPHKGASMKRKAEAEVARHIAALEPVTVPVHLHFAWVEKDGRRDPDNVCFARKFILDALVTAGVLPKDSRRWVLGFDDEFPPPDRLHPRIEVTITERGEHGTNQDHQA